MVFRFKCGHRERGPLWKDNLVVSLNELCTNCKRKNQPVFRTIRKGTKVLVLRRFVIR